MKRRTALALALLPGALPAQTQAEAAARNMQLGLRDDRTENALPEVLSAAGFTVSPNSDAGTHAVETPGVNGYVTTDPAQGTCTLKSHRVPLRMAEAIGRGVADRRFPGKVGARGTEHPVGTTPKPCDGLPVFAPQQRILLSYTAAGNGGDCLNDGSSAILLQM